MSSRSRDSLGKRPIAPDAFVGRQPELDQIVTSLLRSTRLTTLLGPGGIGKTRLADEGVRRYRESTGTPVFWVRLARLRKGSGGAAVEELISQSVIGTDFSGRTGWSVLQDIFTRPAVLVLDNCEHVLSGAGDVIVRLLEASPELCILTTSRTMIGWSDEQLIDVPPLSRQQAVMLFRQRSELTGRPIDAASQLATVSAICRSVHDHPLYIRLAAARLARRPLAVILQELEGSADDDRLSWADGPRVGADARHRGVSDVIAWSYDLCQDKERVLFERLSVFAAGYDTNPADSPHPSSQETGADLEAIAWVCADGPWHESAGSTALTGKGQFPGTDEIQRLLHGLVDQSLVSVHRTPTAVRYYLLESLRIFARQRLESRSSGENGEWLRLAMRHSQYYRDQIAGAAASWLGPSQQDLMNWARAAWDNIVTAIDQSIAAGPEQAVTGLEICSGLLALRLPFFKVSFREIRQLTDRTLTATASVTTSGARLLRVETISRIVWVALCQGRSQEAGMMLEECVRAATPAEQYQPDWRQNAGIETGLPASVEFAWGLDLLIARSDPRSLTVLTRARDKFAGAGDCGSAAVSELFVVFAAGIFGPVQTALDSAERLHERAFSAGAPWLLSWAKMAWSVALTRHGDLARALELQRDALAYQIRTHDQWGGLAAVQYRVWTLARLIVGQTAAGSPDRDRLHALATEVVQLSVGAETLRTKLGVDLAGLGPAAAEAADAITRAREVLGPSGFAAAAALGARLQPDHDEVQRLAMGDFDLRRLLPSRDAGIRARWRQLTPAEEQVATLAAAGWTNTAIAARRGCSYKTVDAQIAAVFQKLVITARENIIDFIPKDLASRVEAEATRRPKPAQNTQSRSNRQTARGPLRKTKT